MEAEGFPSGIVFSAAGGVGTCDETLDVSVSLSELAGPRQNGADRWSVALCF